MSPVLKSRLARLRAFCAALFLFIASVSAPTILATVTADACGMACCVKDGYCCCSPRHASVKGQITDDKPRIVNADLTASCSEGCPPPGPFSNSLLRHQHAGCAHTLSGEAPATFFEPVVAIRDLIDDGGSVPRAPPASSTF